MLFYGSYHISFCKLLSDADWTYKSVLAFAYDLRVKYVWVFLFFALNGLYHNRKN